MDEEWHFNGLLCELYAIFLKYLQMSVGWIIKANGMELLRITFHFFIKACFNFSLNILYPL